MSPPAWNAIAGERLRRFSQFLAGMVGVMPSTIMKFAILAVLLSIGQLFAGEEPAWRTDANNNEKLPWYRLEPGKFPPAGSAHAFAGELIEVDPIHRRGTLRLDRTDAQRRSHWDLPVAFELLPYGAVWYHGAPAELRDIPPGTHLHGQFYQADANSDSRPTTSLEFLDRKALDHDFTRCLLLEDDFSHHVRQNLAWRIDAVDLAAKTLKVTGINTATQAADPKPLTFEILPATRVWKGREIADLTDMAPGQIVQVNLTWATLFGPGRCLDIWLDDASRALASARQRAVHELYQQEHGLAGWIDAVDNQNRILKVTLFGGIDPGLLTPFQPGATSVTAVVAEPTLQTYDPVNDRKSGPLLKVHEVPQLPGSSGVQLEFQPSLLLEGYRPGRIVRLYPSQWPVVNTPLDERLWPERQ